MSRESRFGPLDAVLARLSDSRTRLSALFDPTGLASEPSELREPATAAHAPVAMGRLPPFETIAIPDADDPGPTHGVTVWNGGPKRALTVRVDSAGRGHLLTTEARLHAGRPLRLELGEVDEYAVAVGTDRGLLYEFTVAPEWFDRDAAVTDVLVDADGEVTYSTLAELPE
jgi:hypothetical protein